MSIENPATEAQAENVETTEAGQSVEGQGAEESTLLGGAKTEGSTDGEAKNEGEQGEQESGDKDPQSELSGAPEEYEAFEVPEGIQINPELGEKFQEAAKKMNLTQEQAQEFITMQSEYALAQQNLVIEQRNAWADEVRADKELGGSKLNSTLASAGKALDKYGSPELRGLLDESGLGNHPLMVRFFNEVGKSVSEDTLEGGDVPESKKSPAEILFGDVK